MKMGNWKTTVSGVLTALAGFVAFSPELFVKWPWVVSLAKYIMVGGIASIGLTAKDVNGEPSDKTKQIEARLEVVNDKTNDLRDQINGQ